jgi:hypothetical protein
MQKYRPSRQGRPSLMNKKLASLLLVCLSLFVLGLAFHHHQNIQSHDDCPICFLASHHSNLLLEDAPQISPPVPMICGIFSEKTIGLFCLDFSPYSNRAPPA